MSSSKETIKIKMDIDQNLHYVLRALNQMDKDSKTELKDKVQGISAWSAQEIRMGARYAEPGVYFMQMSPVVDTVRANRDRIPNVTIGGSKKVFKNHVEAGKILFGAEFGGAIWAKNWNVKARKMEVVSGANKAWRRFPQKHRSGYWIFPNLKRIQPELTNRWHHAIDQVFKTWSQKP